MGKIITVGISDMNIAFDDEILITYALGSCVGICLYDASKKIMGLAHILLPNSNLCPNDTNVYKFADTAINKLLSDMISKGAIKSMITAKIAGGAQMFSSNTLRIGDRNIKEVINQLEILHIKLVSSDVGKDYGRTMECHANNGEVIIKSMSWPSYSI